MARFAELGNDLYSGRRSIDFVGRQKQWYIGSAVLLLIALLGLGVRGLNLGLEFTGGSEFRVAATSVSDDFEAKAGDAVREVAGATSPARVSKLGESTVRVQTERLDEAQSRAVSEELATSFDVDAEQVSATFIGPSWGQSVSNQALRALIVFLLVTAVLMAVYYRTWKMSVAALVALAHDMIITVGIYAWTGYEVSPATMIGFLTVLGYSLYDTVVVFDKVRENVADAFLHKRTTFARAANLAVNQTLVRSINTTVIAILPILAVLLIGFLYVGPGVLLDLTLVLFIGMTVGAISSVLIATPLLVTMRRKDEDVVALDKHIAKHGLRERTFDEAPAQEAPAGATDDEGGSPGGSSGTSPTETTAPAEGDTQTVTGRKVHKYAQAGPRNQPKRAPRSKR